MRSVQKASTPQDKQRARLGRIVHRVAEQAEAGRLDRPGLGRFQMAPVQVQGDGAKRAGALLPVVRQPVQQERPRQLRRGVPGGQQGFPAERGQQRGRARSPAASSSANSAAAMRATVAPVAARSPAPA
jgi:hypothetical protein